MIVRHSNQRTAVLVDVQNLYHSARVYGARVDFKKMLERVVMDRLLVRAIAYVVQDDTHHKVDFFDALNSAGFETKIKELKTFCDGSKKADWDIGIAMDAIRLGQKVDSLILASGDGDFIPVVNYVQQAFGCLVEVIAFRDSANLELVEIADDFIPINEDMIFLIKSNSGRNRQR